MIQATLEDFRDHGFADLGRVVDPAACAALLSEVRRRRRFGADMFLTERAFLADRQTKDVNPRPGGDLFEGLRDHLACVEGNETLGRMMTALLGPGYTIFGRKLVCSVPERWMPDWLVRRAKSDPVDDLGAYVRPEFRDVIYFHGADFHQDIADRSGRQADFVTLYIYLHGVGPKDAPLHLLSDSHLMGATRFPHRLGPSSSGATWWRYGDDGAAAMDCRQIMMVGGAGYAALLHPFTLHGSQPCGGDSERISLRYHFARSAAGPAFIDTVNAKIAGAPATAEADCDPGGDGAPVIRPNAIDAGTAEPRDGAV